MRLPAEVIRLDPVVVTISDERFEAVRERVDAERSVARAFHDRRMR